MKLAALIYSISSTTDAKLLGLLKTRFHLETHLQALKKFMLLGQVGATLSRYHLLINDTETMIFA